NTVDWLVAPGLDREFEQLGGHGLVESFDPRHPIAHRGDGADVDQLWAQIDAILDTFQQSLIQFFCCNGHRWHLLTMGSKTIEPFDMPPQRASLDYSGSMILHFSIVIQNRRAKVSPSPGATHPPPCIGRTSEVVTILRMRPR